MTVTAELLVFCEFKLEANVKGQIASSRETEEHHPIGSLQHLTEIRVEVLGKQQTEAPSRALGRERAFSPPEL